MMDPVGNGHFIPSTPNQLMAKVANQPEETHTQEKRAKYPVDRKLPSHPKAANQAANRD